MRRLTFLTLMSAGLLLAACGPSAPEPKSGAPSSTAAAEQSAVMPEDAPPQEEAADAGMEPDATAAASESSDGPCTAEIGAKAADRLVERCTAVSPATHPPCNVANACALIQDEIDRSCAMYGAGETRPPECTA